MILKRQTFICPSVHSARPSRQITLDFRRWDILADIHLLCRVSSPSKPFPPFGVPPFLRCPPAPFPSPSCFQLCSLRSTLPSHARNIHLVHPPASCELACVPPDPPKVAYKYDFYKMFREGQIHNSLNFVFLPLLDPLNPTPMDVICVCSLTTLVSRREGGKATFLIDP